MPVTLWGHPLTAVAEISCKISAKLVTRFKCPDCPPVKVINRQDTGVGEKESGLFKAGHKENREVGFSKLCLRVQLAKSFYGEENERVKLQAGPVLCQLGLVSSLGCK